MEYCPDCHHPEPYHASTCTASRLRKATDGGPVADADAVGPVASDALQNDLADTAADCVEDIVVRMGIVKLTPIGSASCLRRTVESYFRIVVREERERAKAAECQDGT